MRPSALRVALIFHDEQASSDTTWKLMPTFFLHFSLAWGTGKEAHAGEGREFQTRCR